MAKRTLSSAEAFDLRQALHVSVLEALLASRRWEPGDLVFQGGTSLHLAHGSPRFSEDLDFLVKSSLKLDSIGNAIQARLSHLTWLPKGTSLTVSKSKDGHNPHAFDVTISGPQIIGSVRVKVELWQTPEDALKPLSVDVKPVRLASGPAAGAQAFVPSATMQEIYVDKVFALAARPYLKPRDVFDLHWLIEREATAGEPFRCTEADLEIRLATYPNETPQAWLAKAEARLKELPAKAGFVESDLKRWLPASWGLRADSVEEMIDSSRRALEGGIFSMQALQAARAEESDGSGHSRSREAGG